MTAKRSYYTGKRWGVRTIHAKHGPLFEVYEPFAPAGEDHRIICAMFDRARKVADFYNSDNEPSGVELICRAKERGAGIK